MTGFIKCHRRWLISLGAAVVICVVLIVLLIHQTNELHALQRQINTLNATVEKLNKENTALHDQVVINDIDSSNDAVSIDKAIPLDLIDTVFTYYKSKDAKDLDTYKSVIVPDGSEFRDEMLGAFNNAHFPGDEIRSIMLWCPPANTDDIKSPSFEGLITLTITTKTLNGEYLYLTKENGKWYVYYWD